MKIGILILVFTMTIYKIIGQPIDNEELKIVKNNIYLELGGSGVVYSINYERIILKINRFSLNTRIGYATLRDFYAIPMTIHILVGKKRNIENRSYLDIGSGITFINFCADCMHEKLVVFIFGYRFQSLNNGVMCRISYNPFIEGNQFHHWVGVTVGFKF